MPNYSPALPLTLSPRDGAFENLQDLISVTTQNLKMILLTAPGERIMDPEFGVGMRNFLFEQSSRFDREDLRRRIVAQINTYVDLVILNAVRIRQTNEMIDSNEISVSLNYTVIGEPVNQEIEISFSTSQGGLFQ